MDPDLEIEDDFDPIKLGLLERPYNSHPPPISVTPYASADWAPSGNDHDDCTPISPTSNDSSKTLAPSVIAKDFAHPFVVASDGAKNAEVDTCSTKTEEALASDPIHSEALIRDPVTNISIKRTPAYKPILIRRRNGTYRSGIQIRRPSPQLEDVGVSSEVPSIATSLLQSQLSNTFSSDILAQVISAIQSDPSGSRLPNAIREFVSLASDRSSAIRIANTLRDSLDLPLLSTNTDKVLLRKSIAQARQALLVELVSALILPSAPPPKPTAEATTDTDGEGEKLSLTPTNLRILATTLPQAFPAEKGALKTFLSTPGGPAYGARGKVLWEGGVGRMIKNEGKGGFRGERDHSGNLHIFVDYSNILFGLLSHLSALTSATPSLSTALPPRHLRILSLPAFSLLLRRGRSTPPGTLHLLASSPLAQPLDPLVRLGWEVSVLKRVEVYEGEVVDSTATKLVTKPQSKIQQDDGLKRYKEQAVDEILHLKILQTVNAVPGKGRTMVVATGDARGGQFNPEGFVGAVREALKKGWMVELWSFKSGLSRAWSEIARREGWLGQGRFTIWALDDWAEQLVEVAEPDIS